MGKEANHAAAPHLSAGSPVPGTQRVVGVVPGDVLVGGLLHLAGPGPLHAVGRHQHPRVPQRVITQVLVL